MKAVMPFRTIRREKNLELEREKRSLHVLQPLEAVVLYYGKTVQGVLTGSHDFVEGLYLEFQTYNSHGNCFYVYLKSISTLTYVEKPYSDVLDLQTDIRAK
jgi:hypothetical protein